MSDVINLKVALDSFEELWSPRIVTSINDHHVKACKVRGGFPRHQHTDTDEFFLVVDGKFTLRLDDGEVTLGPGEVYVVPRGVYHEPYAEHEASILVIETAGTFNTGDADDGRASSGIPL
ncbi:MAG: cupin domain-containing protein [Micromonosporaceae bacterium]